MAHISLPRLEQNILSQLTEDDEVISGPPFSTLPQGPPTVSPQLDEIGIHLRLVMTQVQQSESNEMKLHIK